MRSDGAQVHWNSVRSPTLGFTSQSESRARPLGSGSMDKFHLLSLANKADLMNVLSELSRSECLFFCHCDAACRTVALEPVVSEAAVPASSDRNDSLLVCCAAV